MTTTDKATRPSTFLLYLRGQPDPIQFQAVAGTVKVRDDGGLDWDNAGDQTVALVAIEPQEIAAVVEVPAGFQIGGVE